MTTVAEPSKVSRTCAPAVLQPMHSATLLPCNSHTRVCHHPPLVLCRPAELEQLVCGGRVVDLSALEAATNYDDGYHRNSKPVRWFWEVSCGGY